MNRRRSALTISRLVAIGLAAMLTAIAPEALALSFAVEVRASTYQVQAGDDFAALLAEHQTGALLGGSAVNALLGISAPVAAGVNQDYSLLMSAVLDVGVTGQYTFQVGTDWGRGGVAAVVDNATSTVLQEYVRTDDIWWNNDWNNADVFTNQLQLDAGSSYTLSWLGFEDCCGGEATIRFAFEGGAFQTVDDTNLISYVVIPAPEPGTALLLGLGLVGLAVARRARISG